MEKITTLKWNWTGHIARLSDGRWIKKVMECGPRQDTFRSRGRLPTKWHGDLMRIHSNSIELAQDRELWKQARESYEIELIFKRITTGDAKWIIYRNIDQKRSWSKENKSVQTT
ncbi:hypothetical protein Trydic_g21247 [Trypoxylus dichotomus]